VFADHRFHVIHTAVTYFYGVAVKDFTEFVMARKMLINQLHEFLANICSDALAEWRIKPYDFPSSAFPILWLVLVVKLCAVTTSCQRILVYRFGFVEFHLYIFNEMKNLHVVIADADVRYVV